MIPDRFLIRYWCKETNSYLNTSKLVYNDGTCTQVGTKQLPNGTFASYVIKEWNTSELISEQCTGLKDKNGKLIYEGDFVQSKFNGLGRIVYYHAALVVAWKNEVCFYGHTTTSTPIPLDTENIEVVGNIHENMELINETCNN